MAVDAGWGTPQTRRSGVAPTHRPGLPHSKRNETGGGDAAMNAAMPTSDIGITMPQKTLNA